MKVVINPARADWRPLCERPGLELEFLESAVKNVLTRVKSSGDAALRALTQQFDQVIVDKLAVSSSEIESAEKSLNGDLKDAIRIAAANIEKFHEAQKRSFLEIETMPGVRCWRKAVPIGKVGIYIPGGTAPLFSTVLMLAIPARLAGCEEIVLCSPPDQTGNIHPAILFTASLTGVKKIFKVGGAQAIAAMAYGTETIPAVYKIFGPGNQYVTQAKQMVNQQGTAIDMPAGPSEVLVIGDEYANASFIAADLLSQAEHGVDSQVIFVTTSEKMVHQVKEEIEKQVQLLPRKAIAQQALENSISIVFHSWEDIADFTNEYAPEHLIINTQNCEAFSESIKTAGSVFLGPYTPESVGDYASGTNHTLPTNGFAKAYSGVSLESFTRLMTFQKITSDGIQKIGPVVEKMAAAEELIGHQQSVSIRLRSLS
jgi:histidinol dehydrogenase